MAFNRRNCANSKLLAINDKYKCDKAKRNARIHPEDEARHFLDNDKPGFECRFINEYIGHGVFATMPHARGSFLLEYPGILMLEKEACNLPQQDYVYFFGWQGKEYAIDGTDSKRLGRFVNDLPRRLANCYTKVVTMAGKPHVLLFAGKDIAPGEELRYDYGGGDMPWRKSTSKPVKTTKEVPATVQFKIQDSEQIQGSEEVDLEVSHTEKIQGSEEVDLETKDTEVRYTGKIQGSEEINLETKDTEVRYTGKIQGSEEVDLETKDTEVSYSEKIQGSEEVDLETKNTEVSHTEKIQGSEEVDLEVSHTEKIQGSEEVEFDVSHTEKIQGSAEVDIETENLQTAELVQKTGSGQEMEPAIDAAAFRFTEATCDAMEMRDRWITPENNLEYIINCGEDTISDSACSEEIELFPNFDKFLPSASHISRSSHTEICKSLQPSVEQQSVENDSEMPSDSESDDEYVPDESGDSDSSQSSDYEMAREVKKRKRCFSRLKDARKRKQSNDMSSCEPDHSMLSTENAVKVSCRNRTVQYFEKRPYCFYCGTQQTQIQRHWQTKHREEREVVEIASLKDRAERCKHIVKLRNLGNHIHNTEVLREGKGEFLVTYRSKHATVPSDYVPCEYCFCYLLKKEFFRHICKFDHPRVKGRKVVNESLLLPPPKGTSAKVFELLSGMLDGTIKLAAKCDSLIIDYASKLIAKKGMQKKAYIRDKVREVARFLIKMRELEGLGNVALADCIMPDRFKQCLTAVRELAGFQEQTMTYRTPSLALKLGHTLQKLSKIAKRNAIEKKDDGKIKSADYFSELCTMEWGDEIARHALNTLQDQKRNKVSVLPLSSDVVKLNEHLSKITVSLSTQLNQMQVDGLGIEEIWRQLAETTLAQVIIFNRRRQGEVSKMTIQEYEQKTIISLSSDAMEALSPIEQSLCKMFVRVEVRGKRDRTVPVLLLPKMQASIDQLMKTRSAAGIRNSNNYVFAYSNSENFLRGSDALRNSAKLCGAKNPLSLRSTNLRKHVATLSQVLNLKENELDMLAQYMGHDIRVHRQFYRLPNDVLQTSKLAKLFLLMDSGQLRSQKGKSLDELIVDVSPDCDLVALQESKSDSEESDEIPEPSLLPSAVGFGNPTITCSTDTSIPLSGGGLPKDAEACSRRILSNPMKRQSRLHCDQIEYDETQEPSSVPSAISLGNPSIPCSISLSGGASDVPMARPTVQKHRIPYTKKTWTEEEQAAVSRHLLPAILQGRLPGKCDIEECIKIEPCLKNRKWKNIKDFCRSRIKRHV